MTRYNGWTNRETWCANLWLTNDEGTNADMEERAERAWQAACDDDDLETKDQRVDAAANAISAEISAEMIEAVPDDLPGMFRDMLCASLHLVSWDEIARAFVEGAAEGDV